MRTILLGLALLLLAAPAARADASCTNTSGFHTAVGPVEVTIYNDGMYPIGVIVSEGETGDICSDQTLDSAGVPHG